MNALFNLLQITLIDLSLAGDNALMVGLAVTALPIDQRKKAMIAGIGAATVLRIVLACFAIQLLHVTGLMVAGGLLLLWVVWKMARELRAHHAHAAGAAQPPTKKMAAAIWQIVIADISMSLDNVLAVAGVARGHLLQMALGLGLSVVLMGVVSSRIAHVTARYPKISYLGIAIILYTALRMIYDGAMVLSTPIPVLA